MDMHGYLKLSVKLKKGGKLSILVVGGRRKMSEGER